MSWRSASGGLLLLLLLPAAAVGGGAGRSLVLLRYASVVTHQTRPYLRLTAQVHNRSEQMVSIMAEAMCIGCLGACAAGSSWYQLLLTLLRSVIDGHTTAQLYITQTTTLYCSERV
jgi:hypothetical protein